MRRHVAFVVAFVSASSAVAQDVGAGLASHLDRIPVAALAQFGGVPQISYGDIGAGIVAVAFPPQGTSALYTSPLAGVARAAIPPSYDWVWDAVVTGMVGKVGFGLSDVHSWSSFEFSPDRLFVIEIDPAIQPAVPDALLSNGYAATTTYGFDAYFRTDEDYGIDFDLRDVADPFGGLLGQASRVAINDGFVMQSPGWSVLSIAMTDQGPSLADRPDIAALVTSLDSLALDTHALVTARLALDPLAFITYAPIDLSMLDPANGPATAAAPLDDVPSVGVPLWSSGLFADLSDGTTDVAVIALSYAARDLAKSAAQAMARSWTDAPVLSRDATLAALTVAPATVSVVGEGPFVALLSATAPTALVNGRIANAAHLLIHELELQRDLAIIAPLGLQ